MIVNVALLAPAGMITLSGTYAMAPVVHNSTSIPPLGATAFRVTVPVAVPPVVGFATTLVGLADTDESAKLARGMIVKLAVLLEPL